MCPELSGTLGETRRIRRGKPRVKKFPGNLKSAQTCSADSGQAGDSFGSVRAETKCASNSRAPKVRPGACAGGGPECLKFPGTSESTQTSSADRGRAGDSFASVRSQTKCAPNFRALQVRPGIWSGL